MCVSIDQPTPARSTPLSTAKPSFFVSERAAVRDEELHHRRPMRVNGPAEIPLLRRPPSLPASQQAGCQAQQNHFSPYLPVICTYHSSHPPVPPPWGLAAWLLLAYGFMDAFRAHRKVPVGGHGRRTAAGNPQLPGIWHSGKTKRLGGSGPSWPMHQLPNRLPKQSNLGPGRVHEVMYVLGRISK